MKFIFVLLLLTTVSFAQETHLSTGTTKVSFTDPMSAPVEYEVFMEHRPTSQGHLFDIHRCQKDQCLHYQMKLTRGADFKWKIATSRDKGTGWTENPARVVGDEFKINSFSSEGKDARGIGYSMMVVFTESGSVWKTKALNSEGDTVATVNLVVSKTTREDLKKRLEGRKITRQ